MNLTFRGNASELKVKVALADAFPWPGSAEYGRVSQRSLASWDVDLGRKSRICSLTAPSVHYRLYLPPPLGRFLSPDPLLGRYVVGTAHQDRGECGTAAAYGWSEQAEATVAAAAPRRGWTVEEDSVALSNIQTARWEGPVTGPYPGNHYWESDGMATVVYVP